MGLLPEFGNLFFTLAAFVVALSIIVTVHEYGHYIIGRLSGIHAEVFSLGFGPVLFSRVDRRGTRWQVAAFPLGGYVKFLGDANAASAGADEETMSRLSRDEKRHTMHGAPLWARAATIFAGPAFNFAFSVIVFGGLMLYSGVAEETPRVGTVYAMPTQNDLREGDVILAIDGQEIDSLQAYYELAAELPSAPVVSYRVLRDGAESTVSGPHPLPARAAGITLQSAARDAGLEQGDVFVSIDGDPIHAFADIRPHAAESDGRPLALEIWRDGETLDLTLTPRRTDLPLPDGGFETRWLIGVQSGALFEHPRRAMPVAELIPAAFGQVWGIIEQSFSGLYHMVTGAISTCNLSGPVGIATTSGEMASDGLESFIYFLAVLSTAVGMLNLFPIPILDGGHLVFHAYEAVMRRPPNEKVLNVLMTGGMLIIGAFMLFALGNDLFC